MRITSVVVSAALLIGLVLPGQIAALQEAHLPTVDAEGRVTFQRSAPDAEAVLLALEGRAPRAMEQDENGVWTLKTEPLEPDLYAYHFFIDGAPADDPVNPDRKPVASGGSQGLVLVPGSEPLEWERRDGPRGTLETLAYHSELIGEDRQAVVYLPPGYAAGGPETYPVLYLLHGVMDDERAWTTAGRANVILDNLIHAGAEPMLVVMPLGYGFPEPAERVGRLLGPMDHSEWMETFARSLESELIPAVDLEYRTRGERGGRAIVGLSMGGAQAIHAGVTRGSLFGFAGSMSGAFMMYGADLDPWLGAARDPRPGELPQLWLTTGTEDFVVGSNRFVNTWLTDEGVPHEYHEVPGGHTWMVWRRALIRLVPDLFGSN